MPSQQPSVTTANGKRQFACSPAAILVFIVNEDGKVTRPKVQKSTDPRFEGPALDAVKHWKFEPGTRNGKKVQFKMRIPIAFKAG